MSVSKEAYVDLHAALVKAMQAKLASGEATAADLNVIRQLLKDSGIDFVERNYDELQKLALPFPSLEDIDEDNDTIQ